MKPNSFSLMRSVGRAVNLLTFSKKGVYCARDPQLCVLAFFELTRTVEMTIGRQVNFTIKASARASQTFDVES
jgi:hypothetical protein